MLGALMSALTQAIAVATGRDFLLGVIPAFDPSGSRNLITWASSMLLITCASMAALVAGTKRLRADPSARGWWVLAAFMGTCSLAWMTGLARLWVDAFAVPPLATWVPVAAGAMLAIFALTGSRRASSPSLWTAVWPAALLLALSGRTLGRPGGVAAASDLMSRVLEWTAMASLLLLCVRLLAKSGPVFALRVDADGVWPLRLGYRDSVVEALVCPAVVRRWIVAAIMLLTAAGVVSALRAQALGASDDSWYRFLFVDFEGNLPTWFSAVLLLVAGVAAAVVAMAERSRGHEAWWHWALMALGFAALSADEAASLHELLVTPLRTLVGGTPWLRYPLVIPGTAVVGAAVVVFGRFVRRLPAETQRAIVVGGGVFLFGALGLETIGGWFDPVLHGDSVRYVLLATAEEACEMTGVTIVLVGLLRYIEQHVGVIEIRVIDDLSHR